jgi:dolichyl-phosphate-mannose-protein mannosyltransferase
VTCYHYKDANNNFVVLPRWDEPPYNPNDAIRFLKDGDVIRLNHAATTRNLHSYTVLAPITKLNYEVSCYGTKRSGTITIIGRWRLWMMSSKDRRRAWIGYLTTRLRFRH